MGGIFNSLSLLRPLSKHEKENLRSLGGILEKKVIKRITVLLKQKKVGLFQQTLGLSGRLGMDRSFVQLHLRIENERVQSEVFEINEDIKDKVKSALYREFAEHAGRIVNVVAPEIVGMDIVKKAAMLQLFAKEPVHILLLGDPGVGKTQILHSVAGLAPISAFGLGSGISKAGLGVATKGKKIDKGLLQLADKGICAIDELNLIKKNDYAYIYNAMEKGFITYTKASHKHNFDTRVRVIATANPKGDRFVGNSVDVLKKQLPFDSALVSRFHLVFLVRKPNIEEFKDITRQIISNKKTNVSEEDIRFIKGFIEYAENIEVDFPKRFETKVVEFSEEIKKNESKYLVEIGPRTIIGLTRLAKASARMKLRKKVMEDDLELAIDIMRTSLDIRIK